MSRDIDAKLDTSRLRAIKPRERPFENALRLELKRRGLAFLKVKPSIIGLPDRLAVGHGRTVFVECKRKDGTTSDVQDVVHRDLARLGVTPMIVEGPDVKAAADAIESRLMSDKQ